MRIDGWRSGRGRAPGGDVGLLKGSGSLGGVFAAGEDDGEATAADLPRTLASSVGGILAGRDVSVVLCDQEGVCRLVAATSDAARSLTDVQLQAGDGPCFDALETAAPVLAVDLASPGHNPLLVDAARRQGIGAALSVPLRIGRTVLGSLCVFLPRAGSAGTTRHEEQIRALADLGAVAISQRQSISRLRRRLEELEGALAGRIRVEQSKGMVAERGRVDLPAAFGLLARYASDQGRSLHEVAEDLTAGRLSPGDVLWRPAAPRAQRA